MQLTEQTDKYPASWPFRNEIDDLAQLQWSCEIRCFIHATFKINNILQYLYYLWQHITQFVILKPHSLH